MLTAIGVIAGVIVLFLILGVLQKVTLAALTETMTARVASLLKDEQIVRSEVTAMSFGQESKGPLQVRGNGALVLTSDEIVFLRAVPEAELRIPLAKVTGLSFVRSHLGKATPFKLLKIEFDGDAGKDSIACMLRKPLEFRDDVERLRAKTA